MKARLRVRAITAGVLLAALATTSAAAAPEPGGQSESTLNTEAQTQFDALASPSEELLASKARMEQLAAEAQAAGERFAEAQGAYEAALALEAKSRAKADAATSRAREARVKLGDYAASAYINGGAASGVAATLTSGSPSELVARQNTLAAVADNSTDLVRVLREAEAEAAAERATAERASASAESASATAKEAAESASSSAVQAQELLAALVEKETQAQSQALAEAALRARVAAFSVGAGSGVSDAKGNPEEYKAFGNGMVPREMLSEVGATGHYLWPPAARAFERLLAAAAADGLSIGITDSYRPLVVQQDLVVRKGLYSQGGLAALPGTSNHGWGTALDLVLSSQSLAWMRTHASAFGFVEDTPRETWHWRYLPHE